MSYKKYGNYEFDENLDCYVDKDGNCLEINYIPSTKMFEARFSNMHCIYAKTEEELAAKISAFSLCFGSAISLILMQYLGAVGLALAGSISGFILLFLTLHFFGWKPFLRTLWNPKFIILTFVLLLLEFLALLGFKIYIFSL